MSFYVILSILIVYLLIWIIRKLKHILSRIKKLELTINYHIEHGKAKRKGEEAEKIES